MPESHIKYTGGRGARSIMQKKEGGVAFISYFSADDAKIKQKFKFCNRSFIETKKYLC